jgi:hypothetical protein
MENKQTTIALYKAIAGFQQKVPTIHKATKAFKYSYANLPDVLDVINPLMKEFSLGFTQLIVNENLITRIFHVETGEFIESNVLINSKVQLAGMNEFQVMGSAITYLRRYSLSAMLGLVTDVDNDAQGEQLKKTAAPTTLSLPELNSNHPKWESAKKALKQGNTTLEAITKVYSLTPENYTELCK